jgi:MerR family transcriptional regulator, light-induced transcriptional regulator
MTVREGHNQWPDLEQYAATPLFNTKAVVQQTGVPAPTLRAWERRYDILSPERSNNDYRLYSERDIATIRWLKERVDEGMAISQAIVLLRHMSEEYHQMQKAQRSFGENAPVFHVTLPDIPEEAQVPINNKHVTGELMPPALQAAEEHIRGNQHIIYNMRTVRERLIEAFQRLDENTSNTLMASMLAIYPVELICTELITPTMWQIGDWWEEGKITVSVEHFSSNFFRGLLDNLLHVTPHPQSGPLVIVCCAPGEPHELAPLMLTLFLRRAGIRVIYLGQSIEIPGLLHTIRQLSPALVCASLTMPVYLATLIDLARQIERMRGPHPLFAFGGQVFVHYTHLISQVPGMYLSGDLETSVAQIRRMIKEQDESRH